MQLERGCPIAAVRKSDSKDFLGRGLGHRFYLRDNGDGLVDLGGRVGVTSGDPQFVCRTSDVSSAAEGDALVTGSVNYTIRDVIDDGTSMTTLMLEAD